MKTFLLIWILVCSVSIIKSQDGISSSKALNSDIPDKLLNGIYFTFQEFATNNPSIRTDSIIITKNQFLYWCFSSVDESIKNKNPSQKGYAELDKTCWGYCLNKQIFIFYSNAFYPVNFMGRISTFNVDNGNRPYFGAYGSSGFSKSDFKEYIIDLKNGRIYKMDVNFLALLLKSESPDLYNQYMNEPDQEIITDVYLKKLNGFYKN